jgi:hypothetical protein
MWWSEPSPSPSAVVPTVAGNNTSAVLLWLIGTTVVVGLVAVLAHRFIIQMKAADAADSSMTRPVLAVLLVGAVVILAAASLTGDDSQTRNILVGGVVSLCSAAAAFYFASSGATEARRDLMKATSGAVEVPDVRGKTVADAKATLDAAGLTLLLWDSPAAGAVIDDQSPSAGTMISGWNSVTVHIKP